MDKSKIKWDVLKDLLSFAREKEQEEWDAMSPVEKMSDEEPEMDGECPECGKEPCECEDKPKAKGSMVIIEALAKKKDKTPSKD